MPAGDPKSKKLGLVLTAGGARAAYQVGVLRHLGRNAGPCFRPKVFTGISAGSINAAYLAQGQPILEATARMYDLWWNLKFEEVMKTNFKSFASLFPKLINDFFLSKITKRKMFNSVLDATPLSLTLLKHIHFSRISKSIESGIVEGLAVSTTNYNTGENTVFFDSTEERKVVRRKRRISIRTPIRIRHIMASCSIPILFEPVRIGHWFYGDGAMRFRFPLSPAIHLGANQLLAIGVTTSPESVTPTPAPATRLSTGLVAGAVLNSIFVDSLEMDYEYMMRLNEVADRNPAVKHIDFSLIRPSMDLGDVAQQFVDELPFHFRQLIKGSAGSKAELGDLLSYLMFTRNYLHALMELGEKDAAAQHDRIISFLTEGT